MKKIVCIVLFVLLTVSIVYATANDQKIYSVDSTIYKDITKVYLATGHALPSTTGPWSGDEMKKMMDGINREDVPQYLISTYDSVMDELDSEADFDLGGSAMSLSGYLNLDLYAHTYNSSDITRTDINGIEERAFSGRQYWFGKDLTKNNPLFLVDWETYIGSNFYTYFNAYLSNSVRGKKEIGSTPLNSNIPTMQNLFEFDLKMLDINFPSRAFLSIGGSGWSVEIGRDRLNWGSGTTGNLVLSDNFPYHDMARFTAYSKRFKYTYLISFFPHKMNYYKERDGVTKYSADNYNNSTRKLEGIYFYAAHRFEGRLFSDKLSIAVTEALTYESRTSSIQVAALSPMYFMHNAYMPSNSNSTLAFEINWTPIKGLALYAQMLLDNFAMPGFEKGPGPNKDSATTPDGKAYLVGGKYQMGLMDGTFTINPEVVYVTPFTYLRDGNDGYGLDYVAAVKYRLYSYEDYASNTDILYDEYVIGYTYGPDTLVASFALDWEKDKLSLGGKTFFMMHGTHDLWTIWTEIPAHTSKEDYSTQYSGITSSHAATGNYRYSDAKERNAIWYTLDIGLSAEYEVLDNLTVNAAFDFVLMKNIYNVKGNNAHDFQFILGVSYKPF